MIPSDAIYSEDVIGTVIRYGLYIGAAFQLICLLACVTLSDEQSEPVTYEKVSYPIYSDSDECSSEHSSPGRTSIRRRQEKTKKRR